MTPPRLCTAKACARPAHPAGSNLCVHCTWLLERDLAAAVDLADELEVTRYRLSAVAAFTGTPSASTGSPLPFDPRAAVAALDLHRVLDHWAARLNQHTTGRPRPQHTRGLARWLGHHLTELAAHPAADLAALQIGAAVNVGWRTVDRPADRIYAGACDCSQQLYARPGAETITCPTCQTTHHVQDRRDRMLADLDTRLMTGAEIARLGSYFGHLDRERARNLLKVWANRGVITPRGRARDGTPLYPFGDTLRLLTERGHARTG